MAQCRQITVTEARKPWLTTSWSINTQEKKYLSQNPVILTKQAWMITHTHFARFSALNKNWGF